MADGALNIVLDDHSAALLEQRATAVGLSPETLAVEILARILEDPIGNTAFASRPEDYEGPYVELDTALNAFSAELDRRLAGRAD